MERRRAERDKQKDRQTHTHTDLLCSALCPDGCNTQPGPGQIQHLGSKSSFHVFHLGDRGPSTWTFSCCFVQDLSKKLDLTWSSTDTSWNTSAAGYRSTYCTMLAPVSFSFSFSFFFCVCCWFVLFVFLKWLQSHDIISRVSIQ